jgi:trehalose-phosphatase
MRLYNAASEQLGNIPNLVFENKKGSFGIHYRNNRNAAPLINDCLQALVQPYQNRLDIIHDFNENGLYYEVRPKLDWHKGRAINWLLKRMDKYDSSREVLPIFIGDASTDEDGFAEVAANGIGIHMLRSGGGTPPKSVVDNEGMDRDQLTKASFSLQDFHETQIFIEKLRAYLLENRLES